jgi:hypothetical protein
MLRELSEQEGADFVPGEWAERPIRDMIDRLERGPMPQEPTTAFHGENEAPAPAQNGEQWESMQPQAPAEERWEQPAQEGMAPAVLEQSEDTQSAARFDEPSGVESPAAPEASSGGEPVGENGLPQSPGSPADFGGGHFGGGGPADGGGGHGPGGMGH